MTAQVALVTGGSQGIGAAICWALAREGFSVIVASRNQEKVDRVAQAIVAEGYSATGLALDVQDTDSFKAKMKDVVSQFGGLHVLVNNAGVTADNLMLRIKPQDYDFVLNTNLRGAYFLSQSVLRTMMKQKWGRIINITSVVGLMGNPGQTNYAASKAGLIGMTKSLAREVGSRGITVNAIAPGYIETEMTESLSDEVKASFVEGIPLGRMGQPEDVARTVCFLAGKGGEYISGQVLSVDGGLYM